MKPVLFALAVMAILLVSAGCVLPGGEPPKNNTNVTPPPPAVRPTLSIAEPVAGDQIPSSNGATDVSVAVSVKDLQVKPAGTVNAAGEGHFRVSIDGGDYASFYTKSHTLRNVAIGTHTVTVEIVNNDGTAYSPPITKSVTFQVVKYQPPTYVPVTYTVNMKDFSYDPASLTVKVGDSVKFVNVGSYPRSATATGVFDTAVVAPGASATVAMTKEGTFQYFSLTHTAMKGTMVVEKNTTG